MGASLPLDAVAKQHILQTMQVRLLPDYAQVFQCENDGHVVSPSLLIKNSSGTESLNLEPIISCPCVV